MKHLISPVDNMDIFLVRVCERSNGSLHIDYKPQATTNDNCIAICYVWGSPDTVQETVVDGVQCRLIPFQTF